MEKQLSKRNGFIILVIVITVFVVFFLSSENNNEFIDCKGSAQCFNGKITRIIDGDTLEVEGISIRLSLVNTPEKDEVGFTEAMEFTASLCPIGTSVLVDEDDEQTEGSFGRMIAKVYCGETNLNAELLNSGHAEIITNFCNDSEFAKESWAKTAGC